MIMGQSMIDTPHKESEKILVVDDEKTIRTIIKKILQQYGYQCDTAAGADEAHNMIKAKSYDLMLSDIQMPDKSGLDLVAEVKASHPDMGVVMVTVIDEMEVYQAALNLDIYGYVIKPIDSFQILISVSNALRRRKLELMHKAYQKELENKVKARTEDLQKMNVVLRQREAELSKRTRDLEEMNNALNVLLEKRENDQVAIQENVMANARKFILPCMERLRKNAPDSDAVQKELQMLQSGLDDLIAPFVQNISSIFLDLTPNEIKVAKLIEQGLTTKEIANALNLSQNTIMTHRYKIRKKLKIKNKGVNLQVFLKKMTHQ